MFILLVSRYARRVHYKYVKWSEDSLFFSKVVLWQMASIVSQTIDGQLVYARRLTNLRYRNFLNDLIA